MPKIQLPRVKKNKLSLLFLLFFITLQINIFLGVSYVLASSEEAPQEEISTTLGLSQINLLPQNIDLTGTNELKGYGVPIQTGDFSSMKIVSLTLNLHGLCREPNTLATLGFIDQNGKPYEVNLFDYIENCKSESQRILIPLTTFLPLDQNSTINQLRIQVWHPSEYKVTISELALHSNLLTTNTNTTQNKEESTVLAAQLEPTVSPNQEIHQLQNTETKILVSPTISPSPQPSNSSESTPTPTPSQTPQTHRWAIRSVSSMKESKDRICYQRDPAFIQKWVATAAELNLTHIAVETPYDSPSCGNALSYTKAWVDAIRAQGLSVWHRHMPLSFEGIYDTEKDKNRDYLAQIGNYIKANPDLFRNGDIMTPIPEPQNGGLQGVTYCPQNICMYQSASHFNQWLRDAIDTSDQAFASVGINGIKTGYYGFDGFVVWGDNNPDWNGILEDATVAKMGNITIDHYPELIGSTMKEDLDELQTKYPNVPIIIGEWGTVTSGNLEEKVKATMTAALRPNIVGFNYWHMGFGGAEELIMGDFQKNVHFDEVQSFFK